MANLTAQELQTIYVSFFGRPADGQGFAYWLNQEAADAIAAITGSNESTAIYGNLKTTAERVNQIYNFLLAREADPIGLVYWAEKIDTENVPLAQIALEITNAAMGNNNGDQLTIRNKLNAAQQVTDALTNNATADANYIADPSVGKTMLVGITETTTADEISTAVQELVGNAAGSSFVYDGTDPAFLNATANAGFGSGVLVSGNDKITIESPADVNGKNVTINDPSTADKDVLTINSVGAFGNNFELTNVETLHANVKAPGTLDFTGSKISGLNTIELAGNATSVTINNSIPKGVSTIDASAFTGSLDLAVVNDVKNITVAKGNGVDTFNVSGVTSNDLITISNAEKGDKIIFGTDVTNIESLTINAEDYATENAFVSALQKMADHQASNKVYYAAYTDGSIYLVANGKNSEVIANKFNFTVDSIASGTVSAASSIGAENGSITLTGANISDASAKITLTSNKLQLSLSGSATYSGSASEWKFDGFFNASASKAQYIPSSVTVSVSGSAYTITGVTDKDGTNYTFDQFESFKLYSASTSSANTTTSISGASSFKLTGSITGINDAGTSTSFSLDPNDVVVSLEGVVAASSGELRGFLLGGNLEDDVVIKLTGTGVVNNTLFETGTLTLA